MSDEFDPYKAWLDLENKSASTTHYKLLGLPEFESDKDRIAAAADKAIRKVRSHKPGDHGAEWSKILDELQEVKAFLLDDQKKAAYDDDLHFADEFVKELEGGMKHDPAAAVALAAAPAKKKSAGPVPQDPRYPPGMAPKSKSAQPAPTGPKELELKVAPSPKPVDIKDSPLYPPTRPSSGPAKPPAMEAQSPAARSDLDPPHRTPVPAAPQPNVATERPNDGTPDRAAAHAAPVAVPAYPPPGNAAYPQSPAAYSQQPAAYGQPPAGYGGYPPQGGMPMNPGGWQGQVPMPAYPMQQPGYPYGAPLAQPMGYGHPAAPVGYPGMGPTGTPMYGPPMAVPLSPQGYMPQPAYPSAPAALDPMAPVAIPGTSSQPLSAVPAYPAPATNYGMPAASATAIPVGTAMAAPVAVTPAVPMGAPIAAPAGKLDEPHQQVRTKSASAVMLAAKKEKESQKNLLVMGAGGVLIIAVAIAVYFVATGGRLSPVASNPAGPSTPGPDAGKPSGPSAIVPATNPKTSESPPDKPKTKPEPATPVTSPPARSEVPKETQPPEKPVETKPPVSKSPPETKPEIKPEPMKPEPVKPEPTKPESVKPEPTKPEIKPEPMPSTAVPTREEATQLGALLKNAKAAIGEFNFSEAEADLAKAEKLAKLPEHQAKLARLKEVSGYVKQFHERLVEAATTMEVASSLKVGTSTYVGMVDADKQKVALKIAGQTKTYQYSDLPVGLAAALADMKLAGSDPVSRVLKGAYVAVHKSSTPDQLKQAKSWWDEATLGGADVTHLVPFLTDSYDLAKDLDKLPKESGKPEAAKPGEKSAADAKAILEGK